MWVGGSAPCPGRFTPGKDPVPIVQEAVWVPGPVWTGAENLAPTGIRSPYRPARNESLGCWVKLWNSLHDFRLPLQCKRSIRSSGMLHSVDWKFFTDVSAQPIGSIFKCLIVLILIRINGKYMKPVELRVFKWFSRHPLISPYILEVPSDLLSNKVCSCMYGVKIKANQSLYCPTLALEGPRSFRLPYFETVGTWNW